MLLRSIIDYTVTLVSFGFIQQSIFKLETNEATIGVNWEVLGPFQIGTREQQWGADPLEAYGGFRSIEYNDTLVFPSSLNGTVHFGRIIVSNLAEANGFVSSRIPVSFPQIDWKMLEKAFGWSGLQFQAWIRGSLHVHNQGRYGIWIGNAIEFYLDKVYYDAGNLYDTDVVQFNRGGVFVNLAPGDHILEIRVVNDIRAFGGQLPPKVEVRIAMRQAIEDLVVADYNSHGGWVVPTVIPHPGGNSTEVACVAGEFASVALRNEGEKWIIITGLHVGEVSPPAFSTNVRENLRLRV